jgi:hypothetical protein
MTSPHALTKSAFIRLIITIAIVTAFASAATAQIITNCKALPEDRTITWCYPIDDASVGAFTVSDSGYITDSLPHTATEYLDGVYLTSLPDVWSGGGGFGYDDKIHTYSIVVTDSLGTFQKAVSFRQSEALPCSVPADGSLNFCMPLNGAVTTSPLRVAAVAQSSIGVSWLQVWVDGVKYITEHDAGTSTVRLMNNHIYLANGKHSVTMVDKESNGTSIKKTVNITIVSQP